jgi:hypothetical protein
MGVDKVIQIGLAVLLYFIFIYLIHHFIGLFTSKLVEFFGDSSFLMIAKYLGLTNAFSVSITLLIMSAFIGFSIKYWKKII